MNYKELAQVGEEVKGRKVAVTDSKVVKQEKNPLDSMDLRERIADSTKFVFVDDVYIKKLVEVPSFKRRSILSKMPDGVRKRVLLKLKKIKDEGSTSSVLGFVLLDDLLANLLFSPTPENVSNLDDFLSKQSYIAISKNLQSLIDDTKNGEVSSEHPGLNELSEGLNGRNSRLNELVGEQTQINESVDFSFPVIEELSLDDIGSIEDSVKKHLSRFKETHSVKELVDSADDLIAEFQGRNRAYDKTAEAYWKAFDDAFKKEFGEGKVFNSSLTKEEIIDSLLKVFDSDELDEIFENAVLDDEGNPVKEEVSVLDLLSEALVEFASGDISKLQELSEIDVSDEIPEGDLKEGELKYETEKQESLESKDDNDGLVSDSVKIKDAVSKFAKALLNGDSVVKLADDLAPYCPAIRTYSWEEPVSVERNCEVPSCESSYIGVPCTREEFYENHSPKITPTMQYVLNLDNEQGNIKRLPKVDSCVCEGGVIIVNGSCPYIPYTCSLEKFESLLQTVKASELSELLFSTSAPLHEVMRVAALCDCLSYIDTGFYKINPLREGWDFSETCKPACLGECPKGSHLTRCLEEESNFHLFGVPFLVTEG